MTSKIVKARRIGKSVIESVFREYQESRIKPTPQYSKIAMGVVIALSNWGKA